MSDEELQQMLNEVHCLDCIEFMKMISDDSVDSCVTDPPYNLHFMNREFDKIGTPREYQDWCYDWAVEVFRVLKPGAHLLAFSGTRTYHRLVCAIEDAGFEIRDQIHWLYGSGFPKGQSISKAIDKRAGYKQPIIGRQETARPLAQGDFDRVGKIPFATEEKDGSMSNPEQQGAITQPVTEDAKQWEGWNTQLKPGHEPVVLARKPISEKSIVENVLKHGTAAINIDDCRIAVSPDVDDMDRTVVRKQRATPTWEDGSGFKNEANPRTGVLPTGRYPANLILSHHPDCVLVREGKTETVKSVRKRDSPRMGRYGIYGKEQFGWCADYDHDSGDPAIWQCVEGCPVRILNEQSGRSISRPRLAGGNASRIWSEDGGWKVQVESAHTDSGGAARFFYCAKPSVAERNVGLSGKRNVHITVKPLAIMKWLLRLVTPRGGIVLDPFLGSGTTAIAAENEGFKWLGCDNNEEYCEIAKARIKALGGERIGRKHDFSGWQKRKKIRESSKSAKSVF